MLLRVFYTAVLAACLGVGLGGMGAPVQADTTDPNPRMVMLYTAPGLMDSGLMRHILPRFSLKTQVRVTVVEDPSRAGIIMDARGANGAQVALFDGLGQTWAIAVLSPDHSGTQRFVKWLKSDIGMRTITSFAPDGTALFAPPTAKATVVATVQVDGDAALGHKVARATCTRCHAVDEATRGWGIGSTPSFAVLRSLSDWESRFMAFYALNPHPSFTQIEDVTEPFPVNRPPPIAPITLTLDDLDAVVAYVTTLKAADLGKPIQHQ